jgi:hypothetical protein
MFKKIALVNILVFSATAFAGPAASAGEKTQEALALISDANPEFAVLNAKETDFWFSDQGPGAVWMREQVNTGKVSYPEDLERLLVESGFVSDAKSLISIYESATACVVGGRCETQSFCDEAYPTVWDMFHAYLGLENETFKMTSMRAFLRGSCAKQKALHCDAVNGGGEVYETEICGLGDGSK